MNDALTRKQNQTSTINFDRLASEYDAWFEGKGNRIFRIETKTLQNFLSDLPKPWLEVGVGSGRFAKALGIETGIDPSRKMAEIASKKGINALVNSGENSAFYSESFGTVFLIATLCFLESPLDVLKEVNRILLPDGKIVLGLILKESPWGQYYRQKKTAGHQFYKYATFYECKEVIKILVKAGFIIERITSSLFQKPGNVQYMEEPKEGYYPDAGFTAILGQKQYTQ